MAEPNDPGLATGTALLQQVSRLIDQVLALDIRVPDEPGALALAATTVPAVLDLAGLATVVLEDVQDHYEGSSTVGGAASGLSDEPASLGDIGAQICTAIAAHEVRDLAFVAAGQIRACLSRLQAAFTSQHLLNMVSGADDALTRLRKGLIPLEIAMAEYVAERPPARTWIDLGAMLEARRCYGRLRRELLALGEPDARELPATLREVEERLAELRRSPIFTFLRLTDRVSIRSLQQRIASWLAEDPLRRNPQAGRVVWLELCTFAGLLTQINKRQELQEHDRQVLSAAFHSLFANIRPPSVIPADLLEQLRSLEGRDDELDRLILHASSRDPKDWQAAIRRLLSEEHPAAPAGSLSGTASRV